MHGYRTSPVQKRLWNLMQFGSNSPYCAWCAVETDGELDPHTLAVAFESVVRRYEILRTTFRPAAGGDDALQVVNDNVSFSIEDLGASAEQDLDRCIGAFVARLFDLSRGPLLRAGLVRFSQSQQVLIIALPALCADSYSLTVIIGDLREAYSGIVPHAYAEPEQYADVAAWQNARLEEDGADAGKSYWRELLQGDVDAALPREKAFKDSHDFRPICERVALDEVRAGELAKLSAACGVPESSILLACSRVLLWRLSDASDAPVGVAVDARKFAELSKAIGPFTTYLPVRCPARPGTSFLKFIAQLHEDTIEARKRQEWFDWGLRPNAAHGEPPFLPFLFDYEDGTISDTGPRVFGRLRDLCACADRFKLRVSCVRSGDRVSVGFHYDSACFSAADVQWLAGRFLTVVEASLLDPASPIDVLPVLHATECLQLAEWDRTLPLTADQPAHALFEAQVAIRPDAIAVCAGANHLTYRELNRRANQLAHELRRRGVRCETPVGICLERSPELLVSILAVLKAGGAYVPLDPMLPAARLAFTMEDAWLAVLVTNSELVDRIPSAWVQVISVDLDWASIRGNPDENPEALARLDQLAYIIYTSGSTGQPKGVALTHAGLANLALACKVGDGARVLQFASIAFDAAVWEWSTTFATGATLVLTTYDTVRSVAALVAAMEEQQITMITAPPSLIAMMPEDKLDTLDTLVVAGEACSAGVAERWHAGRRMLNAYGPTEMTVCASWSDPLTGNESPSIGRPLPNIQLHVLDERGQPVPIGEVGELYAGGVGVARGYLGNPGLTAQQFVPDPFGAQPGARLYRTGDRVRWRPDGQLEFLGRRDHQIKLHGYRIELGEIEAVLQSHPAVLHCAVLLQPVVTTGEQRLVAYVVPRERELTWATLRRHLQERLPDYMTPSNGVMLKELPFTPGGKLDVHALPPREASLALQPVQTQFTPVEEIIEGIWSEVLRRDGISREDDFFAVGGHSLLATQVVARIRAAFDVELPLRIMFEATTLGALAAEVDAARRAGFPDALPIARVPRAAELPLSFAQQRLWFLDRLQPGSYAYNCPAAVRLHGPLNAGALRASLTQVVRRHEVLRTRFPERDGEPFQLIAEPCPASLPLIDIGAASLPTRETLARNLAAAEARRPFDLARGPLFRALLIRLNDDDHILLLTLHHVVSDGWSITLLVRELTALYDAACVGAPNTLPPLSIQYADFAVWQRNSFSGEMLDTQLEYWSRQLSGLRALEIPTDRPRPPIADSRGALLRFGLPLDLAANVRNVSRREGLTVFMTLLAAFQALLARYTAEYDIPVGTDVAGRTRTETESLIGFFVNQLVLRTDLSGDPSMETLRTRVRETTLGAYAHQDLPFERLVEELAPVRDPSRSPLFQVKFVLQNTPPVSLDTPGLRIESFGEHAPVTKFDITMAIEETSDDGLTGSIEFATGLYDAATMRRLAGHFERLLTNSVDNPELRVSELPLLTDAEERQLCDEFNATLKDWTLPRTLGEAVTAQTRTRPDAIALACDNAQFTYAALNTRANQLAHHLRALGVGPEVRVAVCLTRGPELLIAILATLKAGGAYVPIDMAYPASRVRPILENAQVSIIITETAHTAILPATLAQIVRLDADRDEINLYPISDPAVVIHSDSLAYIVHTSGSTGQPKGVMATHSGVLNLTAAQIAGFRITAESAVLQAASISFDAAVSEWTTALFAGGRLVLIPLNVRLPGAEIWSVVERHGVDVLTLPPSILAALPHSDVRSLRTLIMAGEIAPAALVARWCSGRMVLNAYGPTEATVCATMTPVLDAEPPVPIGKPIANVRVYVLDAEGELNPVGVRGELYIGGAGVTRGYANQPALTAESFVPDPFGRPGSRLYRTGDCARWRANGDLEFSDRRDRQIKLRGYRIEPAEIEHVLNLHSDVRQSVVVCRGDARGEPELVAYVMPSVTVLGEGELRRHMSEHLPAYMVPSAIVVLAEWPLTAHGKIDRAALPCPASGRGAELVMDPRDSIEAHLRHIWEDLLGRRNIGVRDDFFQIGGHSLKAVALAAALSRIYGSEVPVRMIFDSRTIEGQAAYLRQNVTLAPPSRLVPLNTAKHGSAIYCVHPAGGLAHVYVDLSKHFDDGHQVYALQAAGLDDGTEPLRTVEEIADLYVREIRRIQPSGPYHLAGLSMGGAVAYEMARQFDQAGDQVGLVALLDPTPARTDAALPYADWESQIARWTSNHVIEDAEEHLGVSRSEWKHLDADDQLLCYLDGAKRLGRVPADVTASQYRRFLRVFGANSLAVDAYRPQQYSGQVHLFRTGPLPGTDETFGWGRVAAGLEMHVFSGRHGAVIADPIAIEVAGMLQLNMDRSSITPSVHDHAHVQGAH